MKPAKKLPERVRRKATPQKAKAINVLQVKRAEACSLRCGSRRLCWQVF